MKLVGMSCCVLFGSLLISTDGAAIQNPGQADQVIVGYEAWKVAKTYGFEFRPEPRSTETVTSPYDGVNTRLVRNSQVVARIENGRIVTLAATVLGSAASNQVTYRMFWGKKLAPDWTIQKVELSGGHSFARAPMLGTDDASYRVTVTAYVNLESLDIRNITLRGPAGADWRDAFSPTRKSFTVQGTVAWNTAKQYGFEFYPWGSSCASTSSPRDGVKTELTTAIYCFPPATVLASVVGGNMIVNVTNRTQIFVMFAAKKLAPGWRIKEVKVSSGSWDKQPGYGTANMSFHLKHTSYGKSVSAFVTSIILEGPSNAAGWQDAFKNSIAAK